MATASTYHHRHGIGFDIHDHGLHSNFTPHRLDNNQFYVLDPNSDTDHDHSRKPNKTRTITTQNNYLGSPKKANVRARGTARYQADGSELGNETARQVRKKLGEGNSPETGATISTFISKEFGEINHLALESQRLTSNAEQLAKHYAGHFEWVLSLPAKTLPEGCGHPVCSHDNPEICGYTGSGECAHPICSHEHPERCGYQGSENPKKLLYFGCNLVPRRSRSMPDAKLGTDNGNQSADIYTVVATKLDGVEHSDVVENNTVPTNITMHPDESHVQMRRSHITRETIDEETESMMDERAGDFETTIVQMDADSVSSMAEETSPYHTDDEMRDVHGEVDVDHRHEPQVSFESDCLLIGEYQYEEERNEARESDSHAENDRHIQDESRMWETDSCHRYHHHSSETVDDCQQESRMRWETEHRHRYRHGLSEAMEDEHMEPMRLFPPISSSASRIEDSVEALDKLEDELEAINDLTRIDRILSPVNARMSLMQSVQRTSKAAPPQRTSSKRTGPTTVRPKDVDRSSSLRKSSSMSFADNKAAAEKKGTATRPTSLRPPMPPARSNKAPTVARRLNEERASGLSQGYISENAPSMDDSWTASPPKVRVRSTRMSLRGASELPGQAISRRRREESETKQRAEEEDGKGRESKARSVRASVSKATNPRETAVSRARQGRPSVARTFDGSHASGCAEPRSPLSKAPATASFASPTASSANKRNATVGRSAASSKRQSYNAATLPARGRLSMIDSLSAANAGRGISRASAGSNRSGVTGSSTVSRRSTVSAEETQKQRQRGKEVFARDNGYTAERERERHEREEAAKRARKEAADRSRMQSREWAEKHAQKAAILGGKKKRDSMVGGSQPMRLRFTS
ncbi:hypothetical protein GE21DRAFT_3171 [Neurospora crassa]|uniref:Uncharacterized protein n=2 Tax=Neurospora crassa TaxID=5141 RepID=Q7RXM8_NEUCR|nr:hypothetical protein NCU01840 [Neurospora crassa OR74A]EAA27388.2 hypothetical protein NCU01840 [Neurospora crassa OR74A]KHE85638.1 hypothetical protein GE21DRAFT_3171 [Neurospora crassa]CAD70470.1 hypothetical protein [Neurospora crassa]|eukprot:XP_956624.2 hypothetical protein NCU01840 [Neurospora crassa OR74A]